MDHDRQLRQQIAKIIDWDEAHANFSAAVSNFPVKLRGLVPDGFQHSGWQLLEHIRLASWDIVEFSRDARHKSPKWPEGFWPKTIAPPDTASWGSSAAEVRKHFKSMRKLITDPKRDILAPIPRGSCQTLLREALLLADHTSYHLGQLVLVRKALGTWKG
jgi:hypothetical protein